MIASRMIGPAKIQLPGVCLLMLAITWNSAWAQSRPKIADVNKRLVRVENIIDQSLLDMLQQIDKLQQEIRGLRGEIESQSNSIDLLERRNDALEASLNARIETLEQQLASPQDEFGSDESGGYLDDETLDQDQASLSDETVSRADARQAGSTSSVNSSGSGSTVLVPSDETNNARVAVRLLPDGTVDQTRNASNEEKAAYAKAYDLISAERYADAILGFDDYLQSYPDGPFSDNAWYWQGEAMYAQRQFEEAIRNFLVVADSFPASPKVPDARLKIGFALYEQSRFEDSRKLLEQVNLDYPGRSASVLARKRLQQMDKSGL